jgi:hypothetical protein
MCRAEGLELGVGVRADFAVQVDFFVLRGGPFHVSKRSFAEIQRQLKASTSRDLREAGKYPRRIKLPAADLLCERPDSAFAVALDFGPLRVVARSVTKHN